MKSPFLARCPGLSMFLAVLSLSAGSLTAEQFGLFTYQVLPGDTVEITDYPTSETGNVVIPAMIDGKPVTSIGASAFSNCSGLTGITMPPIVTGIGDNAFAFCSGLTTIAIPAGVPDIGAFAFYRCSGLTGVTIPAGVSSIGNYAFYGCLGVPAFQVEAGNTHYTSVGGVLFNIDQTTLVQYPGGAAGAYTVPSSVTSIGTGAFSDSRGLTDLTIPPGVTSIGDYAFIGCNALTELIIPPDVTILPGYSFYGCTQLADITIPEGVTSIGEWAFSSCTAMLSATFLGDAPTLGSFVFSNTAPSFTIYYLSSKSGFTSPTWQGYPATALPDLQFGLFSYREIGNTVEITGYPTNEVGPLTIPAEITSLPVTSVGAGAFAGCSGLTSITIPASVSNLDAGAFRDCSGLTTLLVSPANLHFISIDGVLFNADKSELLRYPGGRAGDFAIPSTVTGIADQAFQSCSGLTDLTLPFGVTRIGDEAFQGCSALTNLALPPGLTSIGQEGFRFCSALASAVFMGDAPVLGSATFDDAAPGFTIYYLGTSSGFTSPTWAGYPAAELDAAIYPAASWLVSHGFPYDTNLDQDLNGDGVTLLLAYALDLDPHLNLAGSLPGPVLSPGTLGITYYAASPGIIYTVQTSLDLLNWTTAGVTISALDPQNQRTATVPQGSGPRFLRLVVTR